MKRQSSEQKELQQGSRFQRNVWESNSISNYHPKEIFTLKNLDVNQFHGCQRAIVI